MTICKYRLFQYFESMCNIQAIRGVIKKTPNILASAGCIFICCICSIFLLTKFLPVYCPEYLLFPPASPWISTYIALLLCYSPCTATSTPTQYSNAENLPRYNAIYVLIDQQVHIIVPMLFPRTIESPVPSFPAITMGTALEERQPNVHGAVLYAPCLPKHQWAIIIMYLLIYHYYSLYLQRFFLTKFFYIC